MADAWEWDGCCSVCHETLAWTGDEPASADEAMCHDCAVDTRDERIRKLQRALEPFARYAANTYTPNDHDGVVFRSFGNDVITVGDFRRAIAAMESPQERVTLYEYEQSVKNDLTAHKDAVRSVEAGQAIDLGAFVSRRHRLLFHPDAEVRTTVVMMELPLFKLVAKLSRRAAVAAKARALGPMPNPGAWSAAGRPEDIARVIDADERHALEEALANEARLERALPRCDRCGALATKRGASSDADHAKSAPLCCDEHDTWPAHMLVELPWAPQVRAARRRP